MIDPQELMTRVAGYAPEMIAAQSALTALPAVGPESGGQGELARAELVEAWLTDMGLKVERIDAPDPRVEPGLRPNLAARLPGAGGGASWIISHLDVVPPGPPELWTSDPWRLRQEGDRLYGRGVLDNQAGLVSSLFALKALIDLGITPPGDAGLVIVADEETGSRLGLGHVLDQRGDLFSDSDLIVIPDGGEADGLFIEVAEKSVLGLKVTVTGRQVHASTPGRGVNALYVSARMIQAVRELYTAFPQEDPLFEPPTSTFEPTAKEAGVPNYNTVPGRDVFFVDCRILPQVDLDQVLAWFTERCQAIAREEGAAVEVAVVARDQAAPPTSPQAPVVRALTRALQRVRGGAPRVGGVGGNTVAVRLRNRGLPAAVWGTWPPTPHAPDEWCLISDLIKDAQVFALLMAGLA